MQDKLNTILDNQFKILTEIQYIKGCLKDVYYTPKSLDLKDKEQHRATNVECKIEPKLMAFNTKEELDDYVKNNPNATCEGIDKDTVVDFIKENQGKYLFLKKAYLRDVYLRGVKLMGANLSFTDLRGAYLIDADLEEAKLNGAYLVGAFYDDDTKFPQEFIIPHYMIKLN
jgi:hypothetical protein